MKFLKRTIFGTYEPQDMIEQELEEAKVALLRSQTALDWAKANVDYNMRRIERLEGNYHEYLQPKLSTR